MTHITPDMFTSPPEDLKLGGDEVHIWRIYLDNVPLDDATLSPDERKRAGRYKFPPPRERFIKTRTALRHILSNYTDERASELQFSYAQTGKPSFVNIPLSFNLSHAGNIAIVGVTHAPYIGVDIEQIRRLSESERKEIENTAFTPTEISEIRKKLGNAQTLAFFRCWTRKEAIVKARGTGFRAIKSFSVAVDANIASISFNDPPHAYALYEVLPHSQTIGAIVLPPFEWGLKAYSYPHP